MNTLEQPTIEEEITSIYKKTYNQRGLIRYHRYYREPADKPDLKTDKKIASNEAKLNYLEKKLKNLQLLLDEQAAGWEIVFIQTQNDHDEVWKHASPGPDLAKRLPESHKLDLMIQDNNRTNPVLGIRFMLYQLQTTLVGYQELKSGKEFCLDAEDRWLAFARSNNRDNLELMERSAKKEAEAAKDLFQILEPKIYFLGLTLRHYESVLEGYAKSAMLSPYRVWLWGDTSNLTSIDVLEGKIVAENKNEPLKKGRLSVHIQSIIGINGTFISIEPYNFWEMPTARSSKTIYYTEWTGKEISLDYEDVDTRTEIELLIYVSDNTDLKIPVGALWLRVSDIIHSNNAASHQDAGSTTIDTWFKIAPEGKIHIKLVFTIPVAASNQALTGANLVEHLEQTLEENDRRVLEYHRLGTLSFLVPCLETTEEAKQHYRMKLDPSESHQFVPFFNVSANWCCHCGFYLSQGQGNCEGANRRCEKCGLTCHAQCQALMLHPMSLTCRILANALCKSLATSVTSLDLFMDQGHNIHATVASFN
ncbi:hypothetical protein BGW36DRAFT_360380 [Talaromyces proteolyticus]|uniref:Phorbol-ester/DAG-type domain-containing protein n=1 Tax=Talaromyces proteolyticus TaxID=1131652 RepID=A0AAD4KU13_9EURO|nr:uncharacterized protein BGW36DRAFT_360380 [Talaromyces proteolyticus]KAH8696551.1 hypothetical protein BGW36DRAFT_360380 [Talaromyces proteolyticus]